MARNRNFSPGDQYPSGNPNNLAEFISTMVANFVVRIKPGATSTLQVPAGSNNDQAAVGIEGRWRYVSLNVEVASPGGAARVMDVYAVANDNAFVPAGSSSVAETDNTNYAFFLNLVDTGAAAPTAPIKRLVARATWNGSAFTVVDNLVGPASGVARHAASHATGGVDAIAPADIGAATAAALSAHIADNQTAHIVPVVTSLPSTPTDGQEVDYLADTAGTYGGPFLWRLKYRSSTAGTFKWHVVGEAAALEARQDAAVSTGLTAGTVGEYTNNCFVTLPLGGTWEFSYGMTVAPPVSFAATFQKYAGLKIGASEAPITGSPVAGQILAFVPGYAGNGTNGVFASLQRPFSRYTLLASGTDIRLRHYAITNVPTVGGRFVAARPVLLG